MPDDAIVIDKLVVRYRGKPAVNDLSLRVPAGAGEAPLGRNRAGESTPQKGLSPAAWPAALVPDEPTSGLDRRTGMEFLGTLVELAAEGRTILVSSHSISELERYVSHAAFLKDGKLLLSASIDNLKGRYRRVEYRHNGV